MMQRRVEESRKQLQALGEVDLTKTQSPPRTWIDVASWVFAGLGFTGLAVVAGRRLFPK
jgi:hypothetical protein